MATEVDPLDCDADPRKERVDELVLAPDQREHRAVVVGIGVDVEDASASVERGADGVDRRADRDPR